MNLFLSKNRQFLQPKKSFVSKKNYLANLTATIMLGLSLSACQTTSTISNQSSQRPNLTSAHDLLSYSLLHRFDQSYDYQKSTQYQVDTLYQDNDVETKDSSIFLTLIRMFTGDTKFPKTRDISPEVEKCENQYTQAYLEILNKKNSTSSQLLPSLITHTKKNKDKDKEPTTPTDPQLQAAQEAYEDCLTAAQTDNGISEENKSNSEFTTISSIINAQTPDTSYQTTTKKLTDYFNSIADSNEKEQEEPTDSKNKTDDDNDVNSKNALGVPPKKVLPSSDNNSDNNSDSDASNSESDGVQEDASTDSRPVSIIKMLHNLRITPEQIKVLNDAFLTPKTLQYQGSYNKATGQLSSVVVERSDSKFSQSYKRVPMLLDFNEMSITLEPNAALPVASFLSDKEIPKEIEGKSIKFVLPENIRQNIPLPLLKDSLINAIAKAYSDIDAEKFTETINDDYGKSIHASRVVKINLTSQDVGYMVGRTLKYWSQSLNQIRQQHPEYIKNDSNFAATVDLLAAANRVYRADDLAKLAQFAEAIIPVSYNSFNYYYFDSNNQLIGYRKIRDYRSSLLSAKGKSITTSQIHYRANNTNQSHLYYQPNPNDIIDGNALLEKITGEKKLKSEAQDARFGYADENSDTTDNLESQEASATASSSTVVASEPVEVNREKPNKTTYKGKSTKQNGSKSVPEWQKY